jgi:hypothetical protein
LVRDGSITPPGQELIIYPLCGDRFLKEITELARVLKLAGSGVDQSCGFHVHVQAQDYGVLELRRLLWVYTQVEAEIFELFTSPDRIESRFCKPYNFTPEWWKGFWSKSNPSDLREWLISYMYGTTLRRHDCGKGYRNFGQIRGHKYEQIRYQALNLHSWFQRQTVEFRHHQGTVDVKRLVWWPLFCGWFVEICGGLTDKEALEITTLTSLIEGRWKRPNRLLQFPPQIVEWVENL